MPAAAPTRHAADRPTRSRRQSNYYKPETYAPDASAAYLMRRVLNSMAARVDQEMEPQGLTHAQWVPLYRLHLGHGSTAAELAALCFTDAGAMTRTLDRIEAKGLVRRVRSQQDRRVVNLELTAAGRQAVEQIPPVLCRVLNAHLRGFSVAECRQLQSMLQRMLHNAEALQAEGPGAVHGE